MTKGQIVGVGLFTVGAGLLIYFGFVKKGADGLTFIQRMMNLKEGFDPAKDKTVDSQSTGAGGSTLPAATKADASKGVVAISAVYSTGSNVNIRDSASLGGKVLRTVQKGQMVGYLSDGSTTDWIAVFPPPPLASGRQFISSQYARIQS